ncbi:hypothetical protein FACS189437_04200 [Bacteroidia bacterium]|nr:hypothetical protein FACS189437_04200 [Bacteroidia bacterium]
MIDPEQRKEIIVLLKILQNEKAWDKIYMSINQVLRGEDDKIGPVIVREPAVKYRSRYSDELTMTEEEADEILDVYETSGGHSHYTQKELEECLKISDYCTAHPEECYTWEEVRDEVRMKYGF